ncbi:cell division protein FtsZ [Archaeoglobus profundus]|uniref:Cell division protein FtsZ n=1 Tax=Archaeoglobus profundus (strain DSM 5631 / JCM 9629 / NBRC 100127 / Av18) TaxID=572546 RepID=D2RGK1_ARCPA|nr:cell division protein FtsZ [Archaeoglobus profundus]ADB57426.1 cell division protein FtsZ [Archaeoglobus profundus DSM 5631]
MKSFIAKAQEFSRIEKVVGDDEFFVPKIIVVGVGGSGCNTVNRLMNIGLNGVETIAINTDYQHLKMIKANKKILIGRSLTKGLGAGGYPEIGRKAAESARYKLEELLADANMVFVCAGMGGGTGTGAAPVVAEVAKKNDAIVIGVATMPFSTERARLIKAYEGLEEFRKHCDTVILLDNNKLLEYYPNLPLEQAFSVMDQIIAETIKGITDTIMYPSLVNIDFADVRAIMKSGDVAALFVGESKSQQRAKDVVRNCLSHPLLEADIRGATGVLVHISGGRDLTVKEVQEIVRELTFEIDEKANVIWGARVDPSLENLVRVVTIMTGVKSPNLLSNFEEGNGRKIVREIDEKGKEKFIDYI